MALQFRLADRGAWMLVPRCMPGLVPAGHGARMVIDTGERLAMGGLAGRLVPPGGRVPSPAGVAVLAAEAHRARVLIEAAGWRARRPGPAVRAGRTD